MVRSMDQARKGGSGDSNFLVTINTLQILSNYHHIAETKGKGRGFTYKRIIEKMVLLGWNMWLKIVLGILGGYGFVFGFIRRVNDWYYVWSFGRRRRSTHQCPLPPGDMGWPLLGNLPSFIKAFKSSDPDSFLNQFISRYGRTGMYRTYLFGSPSIIVCSPETCRKILTDDEQLKIGYPTATMTLVGKRSFHGVSNAEHRRLRRLITSPFNGPEALSTYIALIESTAMRMLDEMSSMNKPFELLTEMRRFAFEVITTIFIGPGGDRHDGDDRVDLGQVENLYTDLMLGMKSLAINLPGFTFHKALKARKKLMLLLQAVLDRKRMRKNGTEKKESSSNNKKYMIDLLMEVKDEEGKPLEDEDIKDLLLVFLLAGHESSAHGVLWTLIFLFDHPSALQRAKKEQEEIMKTRPSTQKGLNIHEIKRMQYLSKVIDETLRKTTISFANFRQTKVDLNINGYTIPKGWKVLVWNRGVHMDPELYPNPKEFDPSRFESMKPRVGSFNPFGLGGRLCPGADLARLEIMVFLHHFLLNYRMERFNPDCPVICLPLPRPKDNCLVKITKVT